jgi:hypothetical protein
VIVREEPSANAGRSSAKGSNRTLSIACGKGPKQEIGVAEAVPHSVTVFSSPPEAIVAPSGEKATEEMPLEGPRRVCFLRPDAASQRKKVPSQLPVAIVVPSDEKATEVTPFVCPTRVCFF